MALRRVTSAKGWGEVCRILPGHHTRLFCNVYYKWHAFLPVWHSMQQHFKMCNVICVHAGGAWCWRHPRTSLWNEDIPKLDAPIVCVEMQEKMNQCSVFIYFFYDIVKNSLICSFRYCRSFVTAQCGLQFSSRGVRPGFTTVLARHLDKNTMGYLQWRWGIQSSMNTSIVRDTKSSHFTFAMQVSSQQLYQTSVLAKT